MSGGICNFKDKGIGAKSGMSAWRSICSLPSAYCWTFSAEFVKKAVAADNAGEYDEAIHNYATACQVRQLAKHVLVMCLLCPA